MTTKVPYRSRRGCLTCKQRKKKCDETRPECERCTNGNFECLGYGYLDKPESAPLAEGIGGLEHDQSSIPLIPPSDTRQGAVSLMNVDVWTGTSDHMSLLPVRNYASIRLGFDQLNDSSSYSPPRPSIPRVVHIDPLEIDNMIQFITSQHSRHSYRIMFRPFPFPITDIISRRIRDSSHIRWGMYIGARIVQGILDGTNSQAYAGWIESFHQQVANTPAKSGTDTKELGTRLDALYTVSASAVLVLGSSMGYVLHKNNLSLFLELASRFPELWTSNSAISISRAMYTSHYEITQFVIIDTVLAIAFATPPFIHYDTTIYFEEHPQDCSGFLDWMYGWPTILVVLFARLNSARLARQLNQGPLDGEEQEKIKRQLEKWRPVANQDGQSVEIIARHAIQECWRHVVLIYMYMGACGANSVDPSVESSVQQVAQLVSTIEEGNLLEAHLHVPCLIAGIAARKEKHRKIFHKKLQGNQRLSIYPLRGIDFVRVLDHLWHGAASGGFAVTWDDYVNSRSIVLPVPL